MNQTVIPLVQVEVLRRRAKVPFVVEIAANSASVRVAHGQGEDSDVELSAIDQQGPLYVLLDDAVAVLALTAAVLCLSAEVDHVRLDLIEVVEDSDPVPAIGRLSRLEYPQLASLARCFESFELRVQFEIGLRRNQVRLGHNRKHVSFASRVVFAHVEKEGGLLRDFIDTIEMVVDLVRLDFTEHSWPAHLCPYQVEKLRSLATPSMLLAQLLRAEPSSPLYHRSNKRVVVTRRLNVEFVRLLRG